MHIDHLAKLVGGYFNLTAQVLDYEVHGNNSNWFDNSTRKQLHGYEK
jgi:hypothetical protein